MKICAVVVTYIPDEAHLSDLISRLAPQVAKVIAVDNTPPGNNAAERALAPWADGPAVTLIRADTNLGIGAALNIGIRAAIADGFTHVLLSDQDSLPASDMVPCLVDVAQAIEAAGMELACACPSLADLVTRQPVPFQVHRKGDLFFSKCFAEEAIPWAEILVGITSGSLLPVSSFARIGSMNEALFIDYVDTEWCLRARSAGLFIAGVGDAVLEHRLGQGTFNVWYGHWRRFNDCAPQRMYYRVRNFIFLCKQGYVPLGWKLRSAWNWIGNVYAYCCYSPQRRQHAIWMMKGFMDGLWGRLGAV